MSLSSFQLEWLELPDSELALRVIALWIGHLAESKGIAAHDLSEDMAQYFVEQTPNFTSDNDPALERIMHVIANGDAERGGRIFREYMVKKALNIAALNEAVTGRRRQSANAKKPRPSRSRDGLNELIDGFVGENPSLPENELRIKLRREIGNGVIMSMDYEYVRWMDALGGEQITPLTALKDRLSKSKKKFRR